MPRWFLLALLTLIALACTGSPTTTTIVVYVTPSPAAATPAPSGASTTLPTSRPTATPTPTYSRRNVGYWYVSPVDRDPISDRPTAFISLGSSSERSGFGDPITLVIRCRDGDTDLYINWHQFVDTESHQVEMRLGNEAPYSLTWGISTDYEATFFPGNATQQIKDMFGSTSLVARTMPYGSDPITAVWDISGIENAVTDVRVSCGW